MSHRLKGIRKDQRGGSTTAGVVSGFFTWPGETTPVTSAQASFIQVTDAEEEQPVGQHGVEQEQPTGPGIVQEGPEASAAVADAEKQLAAMHSSTGASSDNKLKKQEDKNELDQALNTGVDVSSSLGQRFGRWTRKSSDNKKEMSEYIDTQTAQGKSTNDAKAEFRKRWAAKELAKLVSEKVREQAWQEVDEENGPTCALLHWSRRSASRMVRME